MKINYSNENLFPVIMHCFDCEGFNEIKNVLVNQAYAPQRDSGSGVNGRLILVRDSTTILDHTTSMNDSLGFVVQNYSQFLRVGMRVPLFKLDSPSTTSSVTYKTQFCSIGTSNSWRIQCQRDSMISTIELLEIAG